MNEKDSGGFWGRAWGTYSICQELGGIIPSCAERWFRAWCLESMLSRGWDPGLQRATAAPL